MLKRLAFYFKHTLFDSIRKYFRLSNTIFCAKYLAWETKFGLKNKAYVTENLQSVISVSPVIFLRFLLLVALVILASPVVKILF